MHRARDKVLFYTILVLSLTRWTTSTPPAQSESCEEQLAKEVINYRNLINPMSWIAIASPDAASGGITQEVFLSLEYNARFVLKLAADFYQWSMTSWEIIAETAVDVDHKIEVWREILEPWPSFEATVCSLVPRLLAFLYTFTIDTSRYVEFHRLHSVLCSVMPSLVAIISPENMNQPTYLCDAKTVAQLLYLKREFPDNQTTTAYDQFLASAFVRKAFELVDGVDKRQMLTTLSYSEDSRRNVFLVTWVEFNRKRINRRKAGNLVKQKIDELKTMLRSLNNQYVDNSAATEATNHRTVPNVVNRLVTSAFKTLVTNFGREVRELFDNSEWSFNRDVFNQWLSTTLDILCDRTPLVLAYLADNMTDTEVPFGLYLTLCGDWNGFLEVQCPGIVDVADERVCVKNAIADRLLMNFYRVTGTVSGYDDIDGASGDFESSDLSLWIGNPTAASNYVFAVHMALRAFGLYDQVPLWTASDWLTGKHLLSSNRCEDRWSPTCSLRERMIILSGNGDQSEAEVPLWEAHSLLLPWHSDQHSVFAFHAVLFGYAYRTMNDFVFRHAEIVSMYLRHVMFPLDLILSDSSKRTFGWYEECAKRFHFYLNMPGPREPSNAWTLDDLLLKAVEHFKQTDCVSFVDRNATTVPLENLADPSAWTEHRLSSFVGLDFVGNLNQMLKNNCANAVDYVNDFIRIAQKSKVTRGNPEFLQLDYCNKFVSNVFVKI